MNIKQITQSNYYERVADGSLPFIDTPYEKENPILRKFLFYLSQPVGDSTFQHLDFNQFTTDVNQLIEKAFKEEDERALFEVHLIVYTIYELHFMNPVAPVVLHLNEIWLLHVKGAIEKSWIVYEIKSIRQYLPSQAILDNFELLREWLIKISEDPDPVNKIVTDYFRNEATISDFKRFVHIDQQLNHRFYDAIALTLSHFSESVKAELSHHYWEEAGEGDFKHAHTYQFTKILDYFDIDISNTPPWNDWRAFAGFNIYFLFALNRAHYFKGIGSLGMPELFDVNRDGELVFGLRRLGEDVEKNFYYYIAHVEMDAEHGAEWLDHIIKKMIEQEPAAAEEVVIGALIRMKYMRLFNKYLCETFNIPVGNA